MPRGHPVCVGAVLSYNSKEEEGCQKGKSRKEGGTRVPGARLAKLFGTSAGVYIHPSSPQEARWQQLGGRVYALLLLLTFPKASSAPSPRLVGLHCESPRAHGDLAPRSQPLVRTSVGSSELDMDGVEVVEADSAQRWGEIAPPSDDDALAGALLDETAATPFVMNEELNFRLALWQGDLTALKVDAIVNCNNEDLNERAGVSGQIFAAAGPQMEEACTRLGECAVGEAKATRAFRLPAKHVIHTVPPPWTDGRKAEAQLERCYVNSLTAATQLHCATVAFACIKTKDAPREQAAHVALRSVRKLLEQPSHRGVQLLIFAMRAQVRVCSAPLSTAGTDPGTAQPVARARRPHGHGGRTGTAAAPCAHAVRARTVWCSARRSSARRTPRAGRRAAWRARAYASTRTPAHARLPHPCAHARTCARSAGQPIGARRPASLPCGAVRAGCVRYDGL